MGSVYNILIFPKYRRQNKTFCRSVRENKLSKSIRSNTKGIIKENILEGNTNFKGM